MGTEIPYFQTEIHEIFDTDSVAVLSVLHPNAPTGWLEWYAPLTTMIKSVAITFPMLSDTTGDTFDLYESNLTNLPSIFLIDQSGVIQLRFDGTDSDPEFSLEMDEVLAKIDELLENPPD
ncbi:hypothetical protein CEE37_07305 [candidate division LCP-89 bacterium B3_LCP]|uniref:Alkyl hydroperoxide reductase subunit C/ Thiol specific antioxidant domain-containing protein n=1 Tax=candidate division LCP-89 bacterium B3_LCP TaxID=2012998 RepID=A0A532V0M2_UNCL8|nr:MAG: hypothetical protein CEE37_07305 [candidate division LCP-89 bacterium B3_LCP]